MIRGTQEGEPKRTKGLRSAKADGPRKNIGNSFCTPKSWRFEWLSFSQAWFSGEGSSMFIFRGDFTIRSPWRPWNTSWRPAASDSHALKVESTAWKIASRRRHAKLWQQKTNGSADCVKLRYPFRSHHFRLSYELFSLFVFLWVFCFCLLSLTSKSFLHYHPWDFIRFPQHSKNENLKIPFILFLCSRWVLGLARLAVLAYFLPLFARWVPQLFHFFHD